MAVSIVSTVDQEPLSLEEMKLYLEVDYDDQDDMISRAITAARIKIENRCSISIAQKQFVLKIAAFDDELALPYPPLVSVENVKYLSTDGTEKTVSSDDYAVIQDEYFPYIFPTSAWPTDLAKRPDAVRVAYTAGYGYDDSPPEDVPQDLLQAIRLTVGAMFENREQELLVPTRQELNLLGDGVPELIAPYIIPRL